jgi:CubicO group peptidase (beta-lactamase class C family)
MVRVKTADVSRWAMAVVVATTACTSPPTSRTSATALASGPAREPSADRLSAAADAYFAPLVAARQFAGTVLVARGDRILLARGYGLANAELGAPNAVETVFRIASISKTFTAAAIVMLAERGELRYTDTLARYIPDFPVANRITIRKLLLHSSGVANPDYERIATSRVSLAELIAQFKDKPLLFEPGTRSQYSNAGYILLAAVIERASGMPYGTFIARHITGPLGMSATVPDAQDSVIRSRASGYVPGPPPSGVENVAWYDMSAMTGSGSLVAPAGDLHRWARAVHRETLYRRAALPYPYGWGVRKYFGRDLIEQSGALDGFTSYVGIYFADSTYVVCLTNIEAGLNDRCGKDLAAMAFGEPYEPVPAIATRPDIRVAAEDTGQFFADGTGTFRLTVAEGRAYVRWATARTAHYAGGIGRDSLAVAADRSVIVLERDGAGRVVAASRSWSGSPPVRFTRQ